VDPVLSPEMKSTGEVMGIDKDFGRAFYKAETAAFNALPGKGNVLLSVGRDTDKSLFVPIAEELIRLGFSIYCTSGTQRFFAEKGITATALPKVRDNPKILDMMGQRELNLVIIIPRGSKVGSDGYKIRRAAVELNIPYVTTYTGTLASVKAIKSMAREKITVHSLEEYYKESSAKK